MVPNSISPNIYEVNHFDDYRQNPVIWDEISTYSTISEICLQYVFL